MPDIVLVSLPFVSLPRPSLALGLLKACLAGHGLPCRGEHAYLRFAKQVGVEAYGVGNAAASSLVGEWAFAGTVFPEFEPDHDTFLQALEPTLSLWTQPELKAAAWRLRHAAGPFLDELAQRLVDEGARVVGCTSTFQQNMASLGLLRRIRALKPEIVTVMGGANCEGKMGRALLERFPWLDYAVSGEADELVGPFFQSLLEGAPRLPHGVMGRGQEGPAPRATVNDMRQLPFPDFADYFATLAELGLSDSVVPSLPVENARGCWWGQKHHCTFCGLNGHGMRFRSREPEQAEAQFHEMHRRHGTRHFVVVDNIIDNGYFKSVLPALAEAPQQYEIFYETKANLKREQIEQCARAGVRYIQPGLESLSDELLTLMDKGTTTLQNIQTLKWSREFGVNVNWLLLFAFPHDKLEWYEEMSRIVPLLTHLQPPRRLVRIGYHRFSPYFERAPEYGIEPIPEAAYGYVYPFPADELAYFFVDRLSSQQTESIIEVLADSVLQWRRRFSSAPPVLSLDDDGETATVLDSRPQGFPVRTRWQGLERRVLLECDGVRSLSSLARALEVESLEPVLVPLEEAGLVLRRGQHVLSLVLRGEIPAIPPDVPMGQVRMEKWPALVTA